MKRTLILILLIAAAQTVPACRLLKPKMAPYPTGVIFPLAEDVSLTFPGRPAATVRARGGSVYLTTRAGFVRCIDAAGRKEAWTFKTDNRVFEPPFLGEANIYARDEADILYALSATGKLLWKVPAAERILTPVVEGGGRIFFGTEPGNLRSFGLDGNDERVFTVGKAIVTGPLVSNARVIFGSADGTLHVFDLEGRRLWTYAAKARIVGPLASLGDALYFGTEDRWYHRLDIGASRPKWRVRLGGLVAAEPVALEGRIYLAATNSVLYCLRPSGGDVIWWANIPSRTPFDPAIVDGKVVAASLSDSLVAFDAATGARLGSFKAGRDLVANAVWIDPLIVAVHHDVAADRGQVVFLKKDVQAVLTTRKASPQPTGEEIPFTVDAVGFHLPRYEFYVKTGDKREVAQKSSEKSGWAWFAAAEGAYVVGVLVTDAKESRETEMPFVIEKRPEKRPDPSKSAEPDKKETRK